MKKTILSLLALALLAGLALANCQTDPCSLNVRLVDWVQEESAHAFEHRRDGEPGYYYSGTYRWDLAIGDSFLVWAAGEERRPRVFDAYETDSLSLLYTFYVSPWPICGVTFINSNIIAVTSGMYVRNFIISSDSASYTGGTAHIWYANFCYAVVEDSFLYTYTWSDGSIPVAEYCINIADPESIFVYRTANAPVVGLATAGLEIVDGYSYIGNSRVRYFTDPERWIPYFGLYVANMQGPDSAVAVTNVETANRCLGDLASNDSLVFYVNCYMGDFIYGYNIGQSNLYVWDRDYTHEFDTRWFGQGVFGVDVVSEHLIAVGFERGLSILNISNLDSIHEVAYYMNPDSVMDFTHFALKENRLYAMGHNNYQVRLYMFELDESVFNGIAETAPAKPSKIKISAHPNPFNSTVKIVVDCHSRESGNPEGVAVEIFDLNGRRVAELPHLASLGTPSQAKGNSPLFKEGWPEAGVFLSGDAGVSPTTREYTWQPAESLPSGVYLVRARFGGRGDLAPTGQTTAVKRVVYLK